MLLKKMSHEKLTSEITLKGVVDDEASKIHDGTGVVFTTCEIKN